MKVLLVHNFYQTSSPSGEDVVFENEVELLRKNGVNVITYTRHNDEILNYGVFSKIFLPINNIWSKKTYEEVIKLIEKEKPDLAHFHNIWYLISPSAYYACKAMNIPIVQTLHNFRIFCTNGLLLRNGNICEKCINQRLSKESNSMFNKLVLVKNAIKYKCYRNSWKYSLAVAFTQYVHWVFKTWQSTVDAYIALTEFARKKFIEAGLPANKIFVKPNFITSLVQPRYHYQNYAVFIGRLSKEKGIDVLIEAIKYLNIHHSLTRFQFKIVGDGPLKAKMEDKVKNDNIENVEFVGKVEHRKCMEILKDAQFIVVPSICYETFSLVIIEAFSYGKPVIASNVGAMAELVEDGKTGLLFEVGNARSLAERLKWAIEHKDACLQMGQNARSEFEAKYSAKNNFEMLMDIYQEVIR